MSTENKDPVELAISEAQDGSAIVELPEGMLPDDENAPQEAVNNAKEPAAAEATDEDDHPNDSDEVREAKRARRRAKKDLIRKTNQEKDLRLQQLQRENEEFKRRLDEVENKTVRNDIARIDKNIEDSQVRLEYAKMKMSEAVSANDGQAMVEAQELFNAAKQEIQQLQGYKQQVERTVRQPQKRNDVQVPDPAVQRNAADWMKRNAWFKPGSQDRDVLVAQKHDEAMVAEGWDPTDADYWAELDSRLQKALPHRYNSSTDTDSSVRKPRNVVGSSGRESSAAYGGVNRNQFTLSPERVKAMKDAGAWDNPERKAKMIKQFMNYDRINGRTN